MIIRFSVENFRSIGERIVFNMFKDSGTKHAEHVFKKKEKNGFDLLKLGMIYGANASGKSNFIKSIKFMKNYILDHIEPEETIPIVAHKLRTELENAPPRFEMEFMSNGKFYAFGFVIDRKQVHEEWLYCIDKNNEQAVYNRLVDENGKSILKIEHPSFSSEDIDSLGQIGRFTLPNKLFLTECFQKNLKNEIKFHNPISDTLVWFRESLQIIFPTSIYSGLIHRFQSDEIFVEEFNSLLCKFDTGIDKVKLNKVDIENITDIPNEFLSEVKKELKIDSQALLAGPNRARYAIENNREGFVAYKANSQHLYSDNSGKVDFELSDESSGTLRMIDLIPSFVEAKKSSIEKVILIDEIDRSLHPNISKALLLIFPQLTASKPSQLIVTTHDTSLLDLFRFRKDEYWFIQKNEMMESQLYSFDQIELPKKIRFDKRLQKDYLLGRFGGVPNLRL